MTSEELSQQPLFLLTERNYLNSYDIVESSSDVAFLHRFYDQQTESTLLSCSTVEMITIAIQCLNIYVGLLPYAITRDKSPR